MSEKKPYSYHTFLFPFLWSDNAGITREKFATHCLAESWNQDENLPTKSDSVDFDWRYGQYHYFNAAARNAIYSGTEKDAVVHNYRFNFDHRWLDSVKNEENRAEYVIICGDKKVSLSLNGIRLKLFNTGIGIMIFELENYQFADEESITWINEYGRRIYMPYSAQKNCYSCATSIELCFNKTVVATGRIVGNQMSDHTDTHLAAPIKYLLSNGEYSVTTDARKASDKCFYIEPIIDDRMFVACIYNNDEFVNSMAKWENGEYAFINDADVLYPTEDTQKTNCASRLYRMIFIDGESLTCHSRKMIKDLLEKHTYDRWLEAGTITGISEYSMVSVMKRPPAHLVDTFLTQYIEMIILALAQRASLLAFERMISYAAIGKHDIRDIQKHYILFQSQLLLKEVTPQQQGIELYKMLLANLFIEEQTKEIEGQIDSLFTQKNLANEASENTILFVLAVIGLLEAVDISSSWLFGGAYSGFIKFAFSAVIVIAAIVWRYFKRK